MGGLIIWVLCGIAAAMVASSKGRSVGRWFFAGLLFGPFGLIFALLAGKEGPAEGERKCPFCAEFIKNEAIVCKHCGRTLSDPGHSFDPSDTIPCSHCGHENPIHAFKCECCGRRFQD